MLRGGPRGRRQDRCLKPLRFPVAVDYCSTATGKRRGLSLTPPLAHVFADVRRSRAQGCAETLRERPTTGRGAMQMKKLKHLGIGLGLLLVGMSGTVQAQTIYNSLWRTSLSSLQIK